MLCADCGHAKEKHVVCANCGKYKGREVINVAAKAEKKARKAKEAETAR